MRRRPPPSVPQADDGKIKCPHCGGSHSHGVADDLRSHRVAHCPDTETPGRGLGYFLLRPWRHPIFRTAVRWWEDMRDPAEPAQNFGFGGQDYSGPGLLELLAADGEAEDG